MMDNEGFHKWDTPIAGWFFVEKPNLKLMITRGTPILGNHHLASLVPIHARYLQVFTKKIAGLASFSKVFHVVKRHKQLPFT